MSNPVEKEWLSLLENKQPGTLEIDPDLNLRLVCGADQLGRPMFFSISATKPGLPQLSDAVEVSRQQRHIDGEWVLLLTLRSAKFTDVFVQLCAHIIERVSEANSESQGLSAFLSGVEEWQSLLRSASGQRLSIEAVRGLFGELWLGFSILTEKCPVHEVMGAWHGPFQSDQDFQFPGGPLIEVKTVHSRARRIQISSENQLNCLPNQQLFVGVVAADDAMADTPGAMTVPALLDQTDRLLQDAGVAQSELARRLAELRFDRADDIYADMHFLPAGVRYLEVTQSFPRIEPGMLPGGVSRVSYSLDLADLAAFERDFSQLGLPTAKPKVSSNDS